MRERISYIDALRGLAVIFMVQQHLQGWFWREEWISYALEFPRHPVMVLLNFCGNFAAPLFILLAGMSVSLMAGSAAPPVRIMLKRGLFIMGAGYMLNLVSPHWFGPASWYVLHLLGLSIMMSPLLLRLPSAALAVLGFAVIMAAPFFQMWLDTPLLMGNRFMNDAGRPGWIFRLALFEGHFPVFPWLSFFMAGILVQRNISARRAGSNILMALACLALGFFMVYLYRYGYAFATRGSFYRIFIFLPYIYPALPALIFLLLGTGLSAVAAGRAFSLSLPALEALGRTSLTWFVAHIIIFNELFRMMGLSRSMDAAGTLALTALALGAMIFLSLLWRRAAYRWSLEWLMRRITGG
jgi:uncharacterized membrane protein